MSTTLALFEKAKVTQTSLTLHKRLSEDDYFAIGEKLAVMDRACQWWIGDWLNAADPGYGEHEVVCRRAGLEYERVRKYPGVCNQIGKRFPNLSFTHHHAVASLAAHDQQRWLKKADTGEWSIRKLREAMNGRPPTKNPQISGVKWAKIQKSVSTISTLLKPEWTQVRVSELRKQVVILKELTN